MKTVPFTQYLLPDGRKRATTIEVDDRLSDQVDWLLAGDVVFESEILTTGEVSLTAELPDHDEPLLAIEVIANGPGMRQAVERLIETAMAESMAPAPPAKGA